MAQTIIGLDIGSYSVKAITVGASFRSFNWTGYKEYVIPHGERDRPERSAAIALKEVSETVRGTSPVVVSALRGDSVMTRFLTLPFSDPKRIDQVLGFELEGHLPYAVGEFVYTYKVGEKNDDGGVEVYAAAVHRETLRKYLTDLREVELDPRVVTVDCTSYVHLAKYVSPEGTVAFVDIGHRKTNVCIVNDSKVMLARSLGRGGMAVTQALVERLDLSFEEAEALKHTEGRLPGSGNEPDGTISEATVQAMLPLVMSLRQTFIAQRQLSGLTVDKVLITGGGAQLANCRSWLQDQLKLPVDRLNLDTLEFNNATNNSSGTNSAAAGLSLALLQAEGGKSSATLNFRRGAFAYEGDFKYIRDKFIHLAAWVAILLVCGVGYVILKNHQLQKELDHQKVLLSVTTKAITGSAIKGFSKAANRIKRGYKPKVEVTLPKMTATQVLRIITNIQNDINRARPRNVAGGPIRQPTPRRAVRRARGGRGDSLRSGRTGPRVAPGSLRPSVSPRSLLPPGIPRIAPAGVRPPAGLRPTGRRIRAPETKPGDKLLPRPRKDAEAKSPKAKPDEGKEDSNSDAKLSGPLKIELSKIEIDVVSTKVKITAETPKSNEEGKVDFKKRLSQIPCFINVELEPSNTPWRSSERHTGWAHFKVAFDVKCPEKSKKKKKGRKNR